MKISMQKFLLLLFVSLTNTCAVYAQTAARPVPIDPRQIIYKASYEISRKQIDGCISPDEAAKLNESMKRIKQLDHLYSIARFRETNDSKSMQEHDPARVLEARRIYDYLQTKTEVNEKWRSPSAGITPTVRPGVPRANNPGVTRGAAIPENPTNSSEQQ